MDKEKRLSEETFTVEDKHEIWIDGYDKHVLFQELNYRLMELIKDRKEMGISVDDEESEINQHINSLKRTMGKLELKILKCLND